MHLYRIHLNPRCREARRDLADPYQMHATLCRAFCSPETKCQPGTLLWRLEPETDPEGRPRVLIQSRATPDWSCIPVTSWLAKDEPGKKVPFDAILVGQVFRFRLRANPCKTVQGKRQGLMEPDAQLAWLARKAEQHGFGLPEPDTPDYFDFRRSPSGCGYRDVSVSHQQMLKGHRHSGNAISVFSVLFEGRLAVSEPARFRQALETGIGHGKVMGLGLLSVAPLRQ